MIFQVMTSGVKGDESGISGRNRPNSRQTMALGKGYVQLAQTPNRPASSMASQRCIPLLCITITSGARGDERGSLSTPTSASTRFSIRLLV